MNNLLQEAIAKVKSLSESEQEKIALLIIENLKELENNTAVDELGDLLARCQVSTGIPDLAEQHDHYIHGTPKRETD
jgi:hypothetical protein